MQAAFLACAPAGCDYGAGGHTDIFSFCPLSADDRRPCARETGFRDRGCKADLGSTIPKQEENACLLRQNVGNCRSGSGEVQSVTIAQQAAGDQSWPPLARSGEHLKGSWTSAQDDDEEGSDVAHPAALQQFQMPQLQHAGQVMHEVLGFARHRCMPCVPALGT